MRLNVPPTLKASAMMDSYSLNVKSPTSINSRGKFQTSVGFKKSLKQFKEDEHSQICEDMIVSEMIASSPKKQSVQLSPSQLANKKSTKRSFEFQEDIKISEVSFLKKNSLLNQQQQESKFYDIKLSQIPKKQLDYQQDFNEEQVPTSIKNSLKRKSSSGDLQSSIEKSSQILKSGLKRFRSIDVINEQSTSSPGTSLNGSRTMEQKVQLMSSQRKASNKLSQNCPVLQSVWEYNKQDNANQENSISHQVKTEPTNRLEKQIMQFKNKQIIEMSQIESQRQTEMSHSNASGKSCQTLNLHDKVQQQNFQDSQYKNVPGEIKHEMGQNKNFYMKNDQFSTNNRELFNPSIEYLPKESQISQNGNLLIDSDKKIFTNLNERFQKIKEIKYGKSQKQLGNDLIQKEYQTTISATKKSQFQQRSTQTEQFNFSASISQSSLKQANKRYVDQIQSLERQNSKLEKQINMANDSISCLEKIKNKYEQECKFLLQKIKRLERILEKNEKELNEWKEFAKQGPVEPSDNMKENKLLKEMNTRWRQMEEKYLNRIAQLQKQIGKTNTSYKNLDYKESEFSTIRKSSKKDQTYKQHIEKLHHYQQILKRNMQLIRHEQQKIIQEWRLIDQFCISHNIRPIDNMNKGHYQMIQRDNIARYKQFNEAAFKVEEYQNFRDNDVASISAKVKSMRSQLARDTM